MNKTIINAAKIELSNNDAIRPDVTNPPTCGTDKSCHLSYFNISVPNLNCVGCNPDLRLNMTLKSQACIFLIHRVLDNIWISL